MEVSGDAGPRGKVTVPMSKVVTTGMTSIVWAADGAFPYTSLSAVTGTSTSKAVLLLKAARLEYKKTLLVSTDEPHTWKSTWTFDSCEVDIHLGAICAAMRSSSSM
jgi:hypothetical protein